MMNERQQEKATQKKEKNTTEHNIRKASKKLFVLLKEMNSSDELHHQCFPHPGNKLFNVQTLLPFAPYGIERRGY